MPAIAHHTTHLSATVVAPAEARAALGAAVEAPIAEDVLETARLLVTELVTNSVRHAIVLAGSEVRIEIDADYGLLRVEVYDSGRESPDLRPSERPVGGFGLQLVDQLADRWGSVNSDEGTCVWFELMPAPRSSV